MLKKAKMYKYKIDDEFYCEIEKTKGCYEIYLCHNYIGIKTLMFGVKEKSKEKVIQVINANAYEYIINYIREYGD